MADQQAPRQEWSIGQQMTYTLIRRHPEIFRHVPSPQDILYVLDMENDPTSKGKPVMARISKISGRVVDFIDAGDKRFMLEWFQKNNRFMTINQAYVLLAQQLIRFEQSGDDHKIAGWEIEEMEIIAERFGVGWARENKGDVLDILAIDFEWGRVGQSRIRFAQELENAARERTGQQRKEPQQATINFVGPAAEEWQPEKPFVSRDNVVPFARPTGTADDS